MNIISLNIRPPSLMCRPDNVNKNVSLSSPHSQLLFEKIYCVIFIFWCCFEKQLEWNIMQNIVQCKQLIYKQQQQVKVPLHAALMCIINNIIRVSTPLSYNNII